MISIHRPIIEGDVIVVIAFERIKLRPSSVLVLRFQQIVESALEAFLVGCIARLRKNAGQESRLRIPYYHRAIYPGQKITHE